MKEQKKNPHIGHRNRLRQEILSQDPKTIHEHKYLEVLLTYAIPYKDVNPLAHNLINEFGSVSGVLNASEEELMKVGGIGEQASKFLKILNLLPAFMSKGIVEKKKVILKTPLEAIKYLRNNTHFGSEEEFSFLCLDENGLLLYSRKIGSESNFSILVNQWEFLPQVIEPTVHSIIICHTHPFGLPEPSQDDIAFTKTLYKALKTFGIRLCDHVILTKDSYFSFFKNKLLVDEEETDDSLSIINLDLGGNFNNKIDLS